MIGQIRHGVLGVAKVGVRQMSLVPESLGKELSELFKRGEHAALISKIENSKFSADPNLLKLKALSEKTLGERLILKSKESEKQANYFLNQNSPAGFLPKIIKKHL